MRVQIAYTCEKLNTQQAGLTLCKGQYTIHPPIQPIILESINTNHPNPHINMWFWVRIC